MSAAMEDTPKLREDILRAVRQATSSGVTDASIGAIWDALRDIYGKTEIVPQVPSAYAILHHLQTLEALGLVRLTAPRDIFACRCVMIADAGAAKLAGIDTAATPASATPRSGGEVARAQPETEGGSDLSAAAPVATTPTPELFPRSAEERADILAANLALREASVIGLRALVGEMREAIGEAFAVIEAHNPRDPLLDRLSDIHTRAKGAAS